jgi:uncharacterized protein (TIGR03435 family)
MTSCSSIRPTSQRVPHEIADHGYEGWRVHERPQVTFGWASSRSLRATVLAVCFTALAPVLNGLRASAQKAASVAAASAENAVTTALPAYDVVTIRPNNSGPGHVDIDRDTNTYAARNVTLLNLIHDAYTIQPELVSGGPKWVDSARFDVHAKVVDAGAAELEKMSREDRKRMLQKLLAERFHLQVHTEIRTLPVYEMVPAKGGVKLAEVAPEHKDDLYKGAQPGSTIVNNGTLTVASRTMGSFADTLSGQVHRTVLDKTGLAGNYNFQLSWTRDDVAASDSSTAPPLFTALEEQLGLKLVPGKGPVTTLVIDSADMPAEADN